MRKTTLVYRVKKTVGEMIFIAAVISLYSFLTVFTVWAITAILFVLF